MATKSKWCNCITARAQKILIYQHEDNSYEYGQLLLWKLDLFGKMQLYFEPRHNSLSKEESLKT